MSATLRGCALPRVSSALSSRARVPATLGAALPGRRPTRVAARAHTVCAGLVQKVNAEEVRVCHTAPRWLCTPGGGFPFSAPHDRPVRHSLPLSHTQLEQIIAERDRPLIIDFFATWCACDTP